jgi:retron-type reverse transcriptase
MNEIFSKEDIKRVYFELKNKKFQDRKKSLPIGVDGVSSKVFEKNLENSIAEIYRKLLPTEEGIPYTFGPLLRIERSKLNGGIRMLHIPRLRDQIVLRLLHDKIQSRLTERTDQNILGAPYNYVKRFDDYVRDIENPYIIKADIARFYDTVPRDKVLIKCKELMLDSGVLRLLEKWSNSLRIRYGYENGLNEVQNYSGLPQGISISAKLAEFYIEEIDRQFMAESGYFRYVDDIIIVCSSSEKAKTKLAELRKSISALGLGLSENKTEIIEFSKGLNWLGLQHYPDRKTIHSDRLSQFIKPMKSIQKSYLIQLDLTDSKQNKIALIRKLLVEIERFISGQNNYRIRWYSLCEDYGQWKKIDKQIHYLIRGCIRKAGLSENEINQLPSLHSKIISYKKRKESQEMPNKGCAPTVD